MARPVLPPDQQLATPGKWPLVGERHARADDAPWTVTLDGHIETPCCLTLAELQSLPRVERVVDLHCVTRWSKLSVPFAGARLADLLSLAKVKTAARFVSFIARSERRHDTSLPLDEALVLETLVAWEAEGKPLAAEHGGPVRVIVPGRYLYKSLKWLERIELLVDDRLGYWERTAGYHNRARPERNERYLAPALTRPQMAQAIASRDFSNRDLRSLDAAGHDLAGLVARAALLRDAKFQRACLAGADFSAANLSNAHFANADLRNALFVDTDVEGADFRGADLRGADLRGASLTGVTFFDANESAEESLHRSVAQLDSTTRFDAEAIQLLAREQQDFIRRQQSR